MTSNTTCRLIALSTVLVFAFPRFIHAQSSSDGLIPPTPAGVAFAELLTAYNTGEMDSLRAYFLNRATQATAEEKEKAASFRAGWMYEIYKNYRRLKLYRIEQATEWGISASVQSEITEGWGRFEVEIDAHPPYGVGIGFYEASRPDGVNPEGKLGQAEIPEALRSYLGKLVTAGLFSGAVLVAKDGIPIFEWSHGWEDASARRLIQVNSKFTLASMSKMFTAVAIGQLAQAGRLSFDDSIAEHLPNYPNREAAKRITIHHLLTHTSGMGDYLEKEEFQAARAATGGRLESPKEYFPFFGSDSLFFEPGTRFEYSNAGYIVLGAIVEAASGERYFEYVTERIFKPAGMTDSDPRGIAGSPAGSAISTTADLLKFAKALQSHRLLDARHTETLLTPRVDATLGGRYGYGFIIREAGRGMRIVGHDGGSGGVSTKLDIYLDHGYTAVILENIDPPAAKNVAAKLQEWIVGE